MLTTILSFLLVLGILIFIHELGLFLAARHVGVKVEAFSIGFPPTALGKIIGETEYRISWVPIGGYVKLFGQNIDAPLVQVFTGSIGIAMTIFKTYLFINLKNQVQKHTLLI